MKLNKFCKNGKVDYDDPGLSLYPLLQKKATQEVNGFQLTETFRCTVIGKEE